MPGSVRWAVPRDAGQCPAWREPSTVLAPLTGPSTASRPSEVGTGDQRLGSALVEVGSRLRIRGQVVAAGPVPGAPFFVEFPVGQGPRGIPFLVGRPLLRAGGPSRFGEPGIGPPRPCLLYTSDAA